MPRLGAMACAFAMLSGALTGCAANSPDVTVQRNLTYATAHGLERMDVYAPTVSKSARPGIVVVHGGAWRGGSRASMANAAQSAARHGYLAFTIDYRLRPPDVESEATDVVAAINDIRAHAARFHLDPTRLSGLGASAGAQLIMQAVVADHAPLRAAVGWSGPYDLVAQWEGRDADTAQRKQLQRIMPGVLRCRGQNCRSAAAAQSPTHRVTGHEPPVLLVNSANELVPVAQMRGFANALRSKGDHVATETLPGSRHAEHYTDDAIQPSLRFLDRA